MLKIFLAAFVALSFKTVTAQEVDVRGALKNIMMKGDLKAYANLDTFSKENLYGLGPVEGLKGELVVVNGAVYSSEKSGTAIVNKLNEKSRAAMFVYSYVAKWKAVQVDADVHNYAELEQLIVTTAKQNGYDTTVPFAFKIEAVAASLNYHVIDWKKGVKHTMENHKQFAYAGKAEKSNVLLLGFYSDHHHTIYTHHTTNMHVHVLTAEAKTAGHLDNMEVKGSLTIYLPVS